MEKVKAQCYLVMSFELPRPLGRGLNWAIKSTALAERIIWLKPLRE